MKRTILIGVAAAVLAVGIAGSSAHGGSVPVHWRVAGTVVNVTLAIPSEAGLATPPAFLIHAFVKGPPGNAQFTVVGIPHGFPGLLVQCGGGPGQFISPNDMVVVFADQSMLFAKLSSAGGWVCFQEDGTLTAMVTMDVIGGTGRFEEAIGEFVGEFKGVPVGESGALAAETGTIEGWIQRKGE